MSFIRIRLKGQRKAAGQLFNDVSVKTSLWIHVKQFRLNAASNITSAATPRTAVQQLFTDKPKHHS